jgi:hypothetical protein
MAIETVWEAGSHGDVKSGSVAQMSRLGQAPQAYAEGQ